MNQAQAWPEDAVEVGRILGAFGVKGWIKIQPFSFDASALVASQRWWLQLERPGHPARQCLQVLALREQGEDLVAQVEGVTDRDQAEQLRGGRLSVPRSAFPKTPDGEYYWVDLIGLQVLNLQGQDLGRVIGEQALLAVEQGEDVSDPSIAVRMMKFKLPIDNYGFQALALAGVFDRETYDWDETQDIDEDNKPWLMTEVDLLTVGPIQILSVPGELFPELAIGGYDGTRMGTDQDEFIASDNPNPPDLSVAPAGPYFKDLMTGQQNWILGLGNDEIGYIVPSYDYKLDEESPYLSEPEGDHYEETNSLGPETSDRVVEAVGTLLSWEP